VRRGNEDNFLVLDLSTEQTWSGADGSTPPEKLTQFTLGQKGLVLVVSDGMGGALAGDVASRMAVDSVREMLLDTDGEEACDPELDLVECLKNATIYANLAIHQKSQEDSRCAGMGTALRSEVEKPGPPSSDHTQTSQAGFVPSTRSCAASPMARFVRYGAMFPTTST
jgi:protein phosphatase